MAEAGINRRMGATEWAVLLALSVLWGGSFLFVGLAVRELPPLTIVVARVVMSPRLTWRVPPGWRVRRKSQKASA